MLSGPLAALLHILRILFIGKVGRNVQRRFARRAGGICLGAVL